MKWILALCLFPLLVTTGCRTLTRDGLPSLPPGEYLKPAFDDRTWLLMSRRADAHKSLTEWLPLGQSPISWTESLGGTFFANGHHRGSLTNEYEAFIRNVKSSCPVIAPKILRSETNDLYYEWRVTDCRKQPDHTELGRFVKSSRGIYRLAYVRKGAPLTTSEREKWLDLLGRAELRSTN